MAVAKPAKCAGARVLEMHVPAFNTPRFMDARRTRRTTAKEKILCARAERQSLNQFRNSLPALFVLSWQVSSRPGSSGSAGKSISVYSFDFHSELLVASSYRKPPKLVRLWIAAAMESANIHLPAIVGLQVWISINTCVSNLYPPRPPERHHSSMSLVQARSKYPSCLRARSNSPF
jgi:hypothetical protein